jgi:hypothetical protein
LNVRTATLFCIALMAPVAHAARTPGAQSLPLEIEYGGCRDVQRGACVVDGTTEFVLWIRAPVDGRVEISRGRESAGAKAVEEVQGGTRYALTVTPEDRNVTVRVSDGATTRTWSLPITRDRRSDAVKEAAAALAGGDLEQARALAGRIGSRDGDALAILGIVQNLAGETDAARASLRGALDQHLKDERGIAAIKDATVLSYSLLLKGRHFGDVRAILARFDPARPASAEEHYYVDYIAGLLAYNSGDDRGTLRHLGAAADRAARMGWARLQLSAEQTLAVQLQMLGRRAEAAALLGAWEDRLDVLPSECERAMYLNNVGWTRLLALEAGEPADDPLPALERAYATFSSPEAGGLCNADEQVNGLLNLALAQLHAGRADLAAQYLERAHAATETPELRMVLWSLDLESRLALARGNAEVALEYAEQLRELGDATVSPEAVWRALVRKALVHETLGRRGDAIAAYADAESLLDEQLFRVPVTEGRETLLAAHAWASQRYVALLLAGGRTADAYAIARGASARALRSLRPAERIDALDAAARARWDASMAQYLTLREEITGLAQLAWTLPRDELERIATVRARREQELDVILDDALAALGSLVSTPVAATAPEGTVEIVFYRLPDGWVSFAADSGGVEAYTGCGDAPGIAVLAGCLLDLVAGKIELAARVRLIVPDELADVDFHAIEIDDEVLLAHAPVVYGLDLPPLDTPALPGRALVVGDTQGNLSAAQEEMRVVRDALEGSGGGWNIALLRGEDADLADVRAALSGADLFHYAGHARLLGTRGWDSELQLGARTALDVSDILALERAPGFVVLSGCETAATDTAAEAAGIGLAQAFIASGTHTVLATSRPVRDATALAVVRPFYDAWLSGTRPEVALQRALLALRAETDGADWSAFRLIER